MNLETISQKQLNELEHCVRALLDTMRKAKIQNDPLAESLRSLEQELGEARRERFDSVNSEYQSY
jgi:hypothetical protein